MGYDLGVDLGTTYTAAAVHRGGRAEMESLGDRGAAIPSVVLLRADETILTGEAANRRSVTEPERVAREFKRRLGDPTPVLLGGSPYSAEALTARLLRWVVDRVSERQGGAPDRVAVCHPANWGPYKQELLRQAIRLADLAEATTITEPQAAALSYSTTERVEPGSVVAVYDLGGGTFDAAVLRKTVAGFEFLGSPEGIERLGGVDFDAAVFAHVARALNGAIDALDPEDPAALAAVARLRQDCVEAKEALSSDTDTSIPVLLPNVQTEVRLTRAEFEAMIRPPLADTIAALRRALASAGVGPEDVHRVLLVGGSSRIPLVAQLVSAELGRPVAVDAHPKHAVALGAALAAAEAPAAAVAAAAPPPPEPHAAATAAPAAAPPAPQVPLTAPSPVEPAAATATSVIVDPVPAAAPAPAPSPPSRPASPPPAREVEPPGAPPSRRRFPLVAVLVGVAVVALVALGLVMTGGGGDDGDDETVAAGASEPASAADVTTAPASAATTAAPTTVATTALPPRTVRIESVRVEGGRYVVDYTTAGYEPLISDDPASHHIHFYWNDTEEANAGTRGPRPGFWVIYDVPSPFRELRPSDRPAGATELCAVVATHDHAAVVGTGNCLPLPA